MFGLPVIDVGVIFVYFAVTIAIGFWAMRRIKDQEDYFLAGRRFGKVVQIFATFGQATSSSNAVGTTTTTIENGISGVWSSLIYVFGTPVYWFTALWYRRLRLLTMGDFFEDRYGSNWMGALYAIMSAIGLMLMVSLGVNAMAKTVMAMTPRAVEDFSADQKAEYQAAQELTALEGLDYATLTETQKARLDEFRIEKPRKVFSHLSKGSIIIFVCLIVLIYNVAGGLEAAFITDLVQGAFIVVLSVLLIPFAVAKTNTLYGGSGYADAMRTLHDKLPESYFEILGTPSTIDFTWYYILALTIMVTVNLGVQANQLITAGSAKDEYTARFGFSTGLYLKRFCTLLWGLFGLLAVLLYGRSIVDPDLAYGYAVLDLLGGVGMGLVGLMIACLLAALMSTADALMITSSSLLTHNVFYVAFPNLKESSYILAGRLLGAVVLVVGCYVALQFESIFQQLKLTWEITAAFSACFWVGMVWRRANRKAAWCSIVATLFFLFVLPLLLPALVPSLRTNAYTAKMTKPAPLERVYVAHEMDVLNRQEEMRDWEEQNSLGKAAGTRPVELKAGEKYTRTYQLPKKSIFWTLGVKRNANGVLEGRGMFNVELLLLSMAGWDLSSNSYALNETIRVVLKILIPFGLLMLISLMTAPLDKNLLDRFFVKMKTPVLVDREADRRELDLSYRAPGRFDHLKLFPNSNWEFMKWDRIDTIGMIVSTFTTLVIIALLFVMVSFPS